MAFVSTDAGHKSHAAGVVLMVGVVQTLSRGQTIERFVLLSQPSLSSFIKKYALITESSAAGPTAGISHGRSIYIIRGIGFMQQKATCENFDERNGYFQYESADVPAQVIRDGMNSLIVCFFWPHACVTD